MSSVKVSQLKYYVGSGLMIRNMLNLKAENEMGLAVGFVRVNNQYEEVEEQYAAAYEGVVEAQFKHRVLPWLDLQYYFQYLGKRETRV